MGNIKSARIEEKKKKSIPKGATKIKEELNNVTVEEIDNGYLIVKEFKTFYNKEDYSDYMYETKKYFSKSNPLTISLDTKPLSEKFD